MKHLREANHHPIQDRLAHFLCTQFQTVEIILRLALRIAYRIQKLIGSSYYRLRVGDYHVIMDIKENVLVIFIVEVGHRREIYK